MRKLEERKAVMSPAITFIVIVPCSPERNYSVYIASNAYRVELHSSFKKIIKVNFIYQGKSKSEEGPE